MSRTIFFFSYFVPDWFEQNFLRPKPTYLWSSSNIQKISHWGILQANPVHLHILGHEATHSYMLDIFYFISVLVVSRLLCSLATYVLHVFLCFYLPCTSCGLVLIPAFSYTQIFVLIWNPVCMQTMIIILVYIIQNVLNRLVCKKNVMVNEIAGYGGLNFIFIFNSLEWTNSYMCNRVLVGLWEF
jgi:hypothetical protein